MATNTKPLIPVQDVYEGINAISKRHIGKDVVANDAIDWVDFGSEYSNLDSATKQIVTSGLISLVTEQLTIAKPFVGNGIDIIRSRGPYSASNGIVQKNRPALPEAVSDADVYDPADGSTSDPFKNISIASETEYFMKPIQFRYEWTNPERWLTGAFLSDKGFSDFIRGVEQMVDNALAVNIEAITMANIRASMALNLDGGVGPRSYNLLAEFNATAGTSLTVANCFQSPDFLRFAIHRMFVVMDYMKAYTTLYNEKSYPQFTRLEDCHFILLSQFRRAMEQNLLSDTFHDDYLKLPLGDSVASWKGFLKGTEAVPSFEATSSIDDTFSVSWKDSPVVAKQGGILATIFDKERVGIYNLGITNTSQADAVGLKTNYWTHVYGQSIIDPYENGVTFYVADPA